MNRILQKEFQLQILFILCVIVPFFNNYELSFALWGVSIIATLKKQYSMPFVKHLLLYVAILLLAIAAGLFFKYPKYYVIRDIAYILKPIMGLLLGYQLFHDKIKQPLRFVVYAGVAIASYHMLMVFYGIVIKRAPSLSQIRYYAGFFNDFEVYALIFILFGRELKLGFSKKTQIYFISLLGLSAFFYLARTNFIQFVILFLALKGFFALNKRFLITVVSGVFAIVLLFSAIHYYNPKRLGGPVDEFLYKIQNAPNEAFKTSVNRADWKDFNDNYRSYENIRTVDQMSHNKTLLFGEGIGSRVNLKQDVYLGDMKLRYISFLHNGYVTVLLKAGLIGLGIYLISIFSFFKNSRAKNEQVKYINLIFIGTGVFLIISNWVFMGFYNLVDTKTMLIGFLFAYKFKLNAEIS